MFSVQIPQLLIFIYQYSFCLKLDILQLIACIITRLTGHLEEKRPKFVPKIIQSPFQMRVTGKIPTCSHLQ